MKSVCLSAIQVALIGCLVVFGTINTAWSADKVVVVPLTSASQVNALEARIATLEANITNLMALLNGVTREQDTIRFSGVNVQVVSGSGETEGEVNGLGNLIVGYNEERLLGNDRTGSHNLIVGKRHNYSSYGGIVVGNSNAISGDYASVTAGAGNEASGSYSGVSGGASNEASGSYSSVSAGNINTASGVDSSVSGGFFNTASGNRSNVSGGSENTASGEGSSISGGYKNQTASARSTIGGGANRAVIGDDDWRAGSLWEND